MEQALDALVATEAPIADIGFDLGFSSQSGFTRFFAANVGMAPDRIPPRRQGVTSLNGRRAKRYSRSSPPGCVARMRQRDPQSGRDAGRIAMATRCQQFTARCTEANARTDDRREPVHRTPSGMGADHPDRGRGAAMADLRGLAAGTGRGDRPQAGVPQRRLQRHHARRTVFPGGERLHADLRPDAQRQPGARLAVSVRRLCRLRHQYLDRLLDPQLHRRLHRRWRWSALSCSLWCSGAWRARICARPW